MRRGLGYREGFDRPAWNRLMDDVRTGMIQCIVVRDLSRFGRDYVETGNYLEKDDITEII